MKLMIILSVIELRLGSEFSAVKCRKKEGPLAVSKLTFPDKYDMLIVWISLWITTTSLCITHGYLHCPKGN